MGRVRYQPARRGRGQGASLAQPAPKTGRCSVIVAAWKAEKWIEGCVRSIQSQVLPRGWTMDLRIGVDGCRATARVLDRMGQPYYWSPENVGPYLIRNSLVAVGPADCYAIFDADDEMGPGYLLALIELAGSNGIAGAARRTINARGQMIGNKTSNFQSGVCVISQGAWTALGSYRPARLAADFDLMARATLLHVPVSKSLQPLYLRRRHAASLTQAGATRFNGTARKTIIAEHGRLRAAGGLVVPLTVTTLQGRGPGEAEARVGDGRAVPRILHRIWFGPAMPEEFVRFGEEWKRLMPDWEHRLWTEENLPPLQNQDLFDRAAEIAPRNVGQLRADIARYEVLALHGGVYVDCDFEGRKSLDPLIGAGPFAAWEAEGQWINNAVLGGPAEHPFFLALIAGLRESVHRNAGRRPNVMSGPQYLTPIARAYAITVYPKAWFYPYLYNELHRRNERFPDAYAVHHWYNSRRKADGPHAPRRAHPTRGR